MRHGRGRCGAALLAVVATAALALAATASAGQVFRTTFHDEGTEVLDDFCGVPGLSVERAFTFDARVQAVAQGSGRLPHFLLHITVSAVLTNGAASVLESARFAERDLRVTDNGDGTLTVLVLAAGNAVVTGADGTALARNPGQVRFELLVDHGGTLTDPSDDSVLAFLGFVKESTGRTDDFCAAVVPALT